jgi:hypothetical protein
MWFWFNAAYLVVGIAFLVHGAKSRSPKNPFLYFGVGVVLSATEDLLPPSASTLRGTLGLLSALAMVVAAVVMFAFAEPAKAKPEAEQP